MNRGSTKLRTQLRETVRAQILDAAEELFAARGLQGSTLVDIAKRAGVAVGTLYNYFTDRDALIKALFETRRATLRVDLKAAVKASEQLAFEPRIRELVRGLLAAFDANRSFIKVAIETEYNRIAPSAAASDVYAAIDDALTAGVREGVVKDHLAEVASVMLTGALKALVHRNAHGGTPFVDDAEPLVKIFLEGARRA